MRRPPLIVLLLGFAGLLPVLAAVITVHGGHFFYGAALHKAVIVYGGLILSFIGGAYWGLAARSNDEDMAAWTYGWSVVPSLAGWVAVTLPGPWDSLSLALCFLALLVLDWRLYKRGLTPAWWLSLRLPLSLSMAGLYGFFALNSLL